MKQRFTYILSLVIVLSLVMAACQQAPAAPQTIVQTVVVTEMVEGTPQVKVEEREVVVTATPIPPTAPPAPAEVRPADNIILALQQEPDTLHPSIGSMMAKTIVLSPMMVGCMAQDENATWTPLGCEEVPTVDNGGAVFVGEGEDEHLEVTFKIRDGWRWTDGTPVTAKDAIFSWKLVMDPEMEVAARDFTEKIYDVVAVDDQTIVYQFMSEKQAKAAAAGTLEGNVDFAAFVEDYVQSGYAEQEGPVVDTLYFAAAGWLPSHILESIPAAEQAGSEYARAPIGDGPYELVEWKQGQEIILEKSDLPFPLGEPKINTIIFRFFAESAAVKAALQNGEIDVVTGTGGLSVNDAPDLDQIEAAGLYRVLYEPGYQWEHIDLNTTKPPLDDVRVRQALYYGVDREALVNRLYFGKQSTTDLPVPPFSWSYTDDITKYDYDPEKAKALLAEAGWDCTANPCTKDGKTLEITLMTTDRADRQAVAQVIQSQWRAIGFGVNLQFLYGRGLFATCSAGGPLSCRTFDAAIYTWITGDDPSFGQYTCQGIPTEANGWAGQNYPGWCNTAADQASNRQQQILSQEERKPLLTTFYQEWTKDVPVIPLFSNTRVYVIRTGLKNFRAGPTQSGPDGWNAWEWELEK